MIKRQLRQQPAVQNARHDRHSEILAAAAMLDPILGLFSVTDICEIFDWPRSSVSYFLENHTDYIRLERRVPRLYSVTPLLSSIGPAIVNHYGDRLVARATARLAVFRSEYARVSPRIRLRREELLRTTQLLLSYWSDKIHIAEKGSEVRRSKMLFDAEGQGFGLREKLSGSKK